CGARTQGRAGDRQATHHDARPIDLDLAAVQEGDHDEPPLECKTPQVLVDVVAAYHVEHDVYTALAGDARHFLYEILRPVVDRMIRAHRRAERCLLIAADGRYHRC